MSPLNSTHVQTEFARAKLNLALHVTGRRDDGYHLVDSLVAFPAIGDTLRLEPSEGLTLELEGPFASDLTHEQEDNLVLKAVRSFAAVGGIELPNVRLTLEKRLPVASGIGGGSSDAAAALRLMSRYCETSLVADKEAELALSLGADVPVCLTQSASRMSGIGEKLANVPVMPAAGVVLVNPLKTVSTPDVFERMAQKDNAPLPPLPDCFESLEGLVSYLRDTRNDMQRAAETLCADIIDVNETLIAQPGVKFARMSGSGATCFALCDTGQEALIAKAVNQTHPHWWVASGELHS